MPDIVENLRWIEGKYKSQMAKDCADEIEMLRAEIEKLREERDAAIHEVEILEARVFFNKRGV